MAQEERREVTERPEVREALNRITENTVARVYEETGSTGSFTIVFASGEQLTVSETGGPGADGEWYTYPQVLLNGKQIWHG